MALSLSDLRKYLSMPSLVGRKGVERVFRAVREAKRHGWSICENIRVGIAHEVTFADCCEKAFIVPMFFPQYFEIFILDYL